MTSAIVVAMRYLKNGRSIELHGRKKKNLYVYFDNDQDAYAAFNALTLKKLMS